MPAQEEFNVALNNFKDEVNGTIQEDIPMWLLDSVKLQWCTNISLPTALLLEITGGGCDNNKNSLEECKTKKLPIKSISTQLSAGQFFFLSFLRLVLQFQCHWHYLRDIFLVSFLVPRIHKVCEQAKLQGLFCCVLISFFKYVP